MTPRPAQLFFDAVKAQWTLPDWDVESVRLLPDSDYFVVIVAKKRGLDGKSRLTAVGALGKKLRAAASNADAMRALVRDCVDSTERSIAAHDAA